ncbi:hypothetical protein GCM10007978_37540 [Shewanella hanedai]|nr:hypothetical protein GCM10007978_37540 [Shewanella hanedai]
MDMKMFNIGDCLGDLRIWVTCTAITQSQNLLRAIRLESCAIHLSQLQPELK